MLKAMGAALALLLAPFAAASAQDWPIRAVTMIVPYAAGGPVDTLGRILAARLSEILGQQVVVENVPGAGGMTGASRAAKAAPDGYTVLLSGSAVLAINQTLYKKPLYNAVTDFEHVALFSDSARVLVTRKDFPANTLSDFVAYAKANQAKLQYGSAGAGSGMHVCAVLLDAAMGTRITHVPYRGSAPAMTDLIAGRLDYMFDGVSTSLGYLQAGTIRMLGVAGPTRSPVLPDQPTISESGLPGFDTMVWFGLFAPAGTPKPAVELLNRKMNAVLATPRVKEALEKLGVEPVGGGPDALAAKVQSELQKWATIVREKNIRLEQ
jgi:tripartite-type tricarboxylate transporter receptor subunit TctC